MDKEEIKHFKALLKQGIIRHRNMLLDYKFQEELLKVIKNYEQLKQENEKLKQQLEQRDNIINKAREFINKYDGSMWYSTSIVIINELLEILNIDKGE